METSSKKGIYIGNGIVQTKIEPEAISTAHRTTSLMRGEKLIAMTIEHLMCALKALHIYNANIVFIQGSEIPILDGSAIQYIEKIDPIIEIEQRSVNTIRVVKKLSKLMVCVLYIFIYCMG